ncbi:MAG: hypothetical protein M3P06_05315 [Acidobacteriota bacterium]|nr:hypothetical protein [Acidobacteriota bacterium]
MQIISKMLLIMFVAATSLAADTQAVSVQDIRHHYQILGDKSAVLYDVTEINRYSDESSENYVLIRDIGHGDFVMRNTWSYKDQTVTYRISDVKDRTYIQASAITPFSSKTRLETLAESRRNPDLKQLPAIVKFETNGGRWDSIETDWEDENRLREFRHQLRQTFDFSLLEAIERMRGTVFTTEVADVFYALIGQLVVYDSTSEDKTAVGVKIQASTPDCAFDANYGFPCSAKQLERTAKAVKEGKALDRY